MMRGLFTLFQYQSKPTSKLCGGTMGFVTHKYEWQEAVQDPDDPMKGYMNSGTTTLHIPYCDKCNDWKIKTNKTTETYWNDEPDNSSAQKTMKTGCAMAVIPLVIPIIVLPIAGFQDLYFASSICSLGFFIAGVITVFMGMKESKPRTRSTKVTCVYTCLTCNNQWWVVDDSDYSANPLKYTINDVPLRLRKYADG
jgi:hypothetical protein